MEVIVPLVPKDGLQGGKLVDLEAGLQRVRERCGKIVKGSYKMEPYYGFIL